MSTPSTTSLAIFLGVYLTPENVVAVAVDENGEEVVQSSAPYNFPPNPAPPKGRIEQDPEVWWDATRLALGHLTTQLRSTGVTPSQLRGISVSGPPGTLVIQDQAGKVLCPAIMPSDIRAADQLPRLNMLGQDHCRKMGIKFRGDDTIAKIAWVKDNLPELYEVAVFAHQPDYILGRLKGTPNTTDFSIASNTACDLVDENWPDWLDYDMHLGVRERLPRLTHLGEVVGKLCSAAAAATG
ncbi:MAG: FGGY family carbohydrate kinase, partial [Planctomycetaceae bacterium]|nr:FGGY family carbohydrate kinase [Planctomycetaceae bacterium]